MIAKNKTTQKTISALIIIAIILPAVLFSKPKQAEAFGPVFDFLTEIFTGSTGGSATVSAVQNTTQTGLKWKDIAKEILRQSIMVIERRILQKITQNTINWINNGFHGNPLYLENPKSFFKDIAKYEIKTLVDEIGYNRLKYPFGQDYALNVIASYKRPAADNEQYTLSKVINDPYLLERFRNDFNVGGWNGFLINTQYPQNNYLGFQMIETEKLARKLAGTTFTATQKVQDTLQKGMGFLSPQMCPPDRNPNYNNGKNEFQKPSFKSKTPPPDLEDCLRIYESNPEEEQACNSRNADAISSYDGQVAVERGEWGKTNTCPGGLVDTTPGSVVANQINNAFSSKFRSSELAGALGNSISSILDTFLAHFLDKGLNALSSNTNPPPDNPDTWDYLGNTLGSPTDANSRFGSGPDKPIIIADFKKQIDGHTDRVAVVGETIQDADGNDIIAQGGEIISEIGGSISDPNYIPGDIANTEKELKLIYNDDQNPENPDQDLGPGITQMMGTIWPKVRELDLCVPGPDLGWQSRILDEVDRNSKKLQEEASADDGEKSFQAGSVLKELQFTIGYFKDWISNKMLTELPKSVIFMDAVEEIETLYQESDELTDAKRLKTQALARLEAIKEVLDTINTQPEPGSDDEKTIIQMKKQYDATRDEIASPASVDNRRNELNVAKEKYKKLDKLIPECKTERVAKGWTANPTGRSSTYLDKGTEQNLFCDFPIKGGYDHDSFKGPNTTIPKLPMINAKDVMNWPRFFGLFGTERIDIEMNCNYIYKTSIPDYKKDLPGVTDITEGYDNTWEGPGSGDGPYVGGGGGDPGIPEEEPDGLSSMCADVVTERAKYTDITTGRGIGDDRIGETELSQILTAVAAKNSGAGWGLLSKGTGNNCGTGFGKVACDIMFNGKSCLIYDVFSDSGGSDGPGRSVPSCQFKGGMTRSRWVGNGSWASATTPPCTAVIPGGGGYTTPYLTPYPYPTPSTIGNPVINSLSVSTARIGDLLIITGTNLSSTVQFYKK